MSTHLLAPNPCLVAILVIVKTTSEPRLVFHYPPKPGEDNARFQNLVKEGTADDTSTTSSDDGESSGVEIAPVEEAQVLPQVDHGRSDVDEVGSISPDKNDAFPDQIAQAEWNDIFGYRAGVLAKLLCPPETSHKKRLEIGLDGKTFLGQPVFATPEGAWKTKKPRNSSSKGTGPHGVVSAREEGDKQSLKNGSHEKLSAIVTERKQEPSSDTGADSQEDAEHLEDEDNQPKQNSSVSRKDPLSGEKKSKTSLKMFQVCFILDPPPLEHHLRVKEMYDHVVRKMAKALRWEQARSNYVTKEASAITSTVKRLNRTNGKLSNLSSLYHDIISQSSLARAIAMLYNCLTTSRIAHLNLTAATSLSLQIPIPVSISTLSSALSPQVPGLWLTTTTSMPVENDVQRSSSQLGAHFGLLLLADFHTILADVNAAVSPIAAPLSHYLRVSKPTKSFHQISQSSSIPLEHIQFLASHLIYWRRARAIPPLNQRDTYIVSPNADTRNLATAMASFAKAFPALPALPKILSMLSTTPRPFSSLIPSRDHKEAYLEILAWLMRGGWVTQLRTFAWIRVPTAILNKADINDISNTITNGTSSTELDDQNPFLDLGSPEVPKFAVSSPASSTSTTIHIPTNKSKRSLVIAKPSSPTSQQARYLAHISQEVRVVQGDESGKAWDKCVRYFDGSHAIESIGIIEGWKKKRTFELVTGWEELGILLKNRRW